MNARACTDPQVAVLLHAYELGSLDGPELERFEEHLIGCARCFEDVRSFQAEAAALRGDPQVRALVLEAAAQAAADPAPAAAGAGWRRLWPPVPWLLRPLVPYAALLLVAAFATSRWLVARHPAAQPGLQPLQAITLAPGRSADDAQLRISTGGPAVVRFVFEDARPDQPCAVTVLAEDGRVVWTDPAFGAFDSHQSGWLLLPLARMLPGTYRLVIRDPRLPADLATREHRFRIVP